MTSSALEWDYYEFEPVETSSLVYATPGASSLLLPANPVNSHWSSNAISDWSMSNHTDPTSEIVQDPMAMVKATKEEKNKKNQRRKARKNPRRSEREKEVSNCFVHLPCLEPPCSMSACATCRASSWRGSCATLAWLRASATSLALESAHTVLTLFHHVGESTKIFQNKDLDLRGCKPLKMPR